MQNQQNWKNVYHLWFDIYHMLVGLAIFQQNAQNKVVQNLNLNNYIVVRLYQNRWRWESKALIKKIKIGLGSSRVQVLFGEN